MNVGFITVGDPTRLTGGYLYHRQLFAGLKQYDIVVDEVVASAATIDAQCAAAPAFGATLDVEQYDVVVIDALARGVCAPWIDHWRTKRPAITLVHELPSVAAAGPDTEREQILEAPLLRADQVIAVSEHGASILREHAVPTERLHIVSPGYDRLSIGGAPFRIAHPDALRALCVAQWIPRKAIDLLVRAWAQQPRHSAVLELIGETEADPAYTTLVQSAIAATPNANIIVHGSVDDATLDAAYLHADLFVLPSRYEGYGMVYAEALAYGLPIIACDVGPVPALVGSDAAMLIACDDEHALAAALARVLTDRALRRRMARSAHDRACQLPTWNDTVERFCQVLRQVCQERYAAA